MESIYSISGFQEPMSCFTHLFAAPVFLVLGLCLVRKGKGHGGRVASLSIFAATTVFLLSMSGVYHLLGPGAGRQVLRQLDISAVFALIAGTITPVHAILFRGLMRWVPLTLIWATAAAGITLRAVFPEGLPYGMGTSIFLFMGWGGAIACCSLWSRHGFQFIKPVVYGGLAYTVGAVVMLAYWPTLIPGVLGPHEIWHLAVLLGLSFHWKFVFQIAQGISTPVANQPSDKISCHQSVPCIRSPSPAV